MSFFKKLFIQLVFLFLAIPLFATPYNLDESHTQLGFKVKHLGISYVKGHFKKFQGHGEFDEASGQIKNLDVTIDASSIDTNEPDRDKHLRSGDFFDVANHPKLSFKLIKVNYNGKIPQSIQGKITIRGVTKDITLNITDWGGTAEDPWGNQRVAFEAEGSLDRREFGLTWNKGLKQAAGLAVGNEVKLMLAIEGIKVQPK